MTSEVSVSSNQGLGQIDFEDDTYASAPRWFAVSMCICLTVWMASGLHDQRRPDEQVLSVSRAPQLVAVTHSRAEGKELSITASGYSVPFRTSQVRVNATGRITSVSSLRGGLVEAGEEIARISDDAVEAHLAQAELRLDQVEGDLVRLEAMLSRGLTTEALVMEMRAAKAAAMSEVVSARQELTNTVVRAPFSGKLNDLMVRTGQFVASGETVAEILDNDPLVVVLQVPQRQLADVKLGNPATIEFVTGEVESGAISYIASNADSSTRTYRVELLISNEGSKLPAGLSARVEIASNTVQAHFVSPAALSLGVNGETGVKTVDLENKVVFVPVKVVQGQIDGVWVTGLDESAVIISVGQGFVEVGELVMPQRVDVLTSMNVGTDGPL